MIPLKTQITTKSISNGHIKKIKTTVVADLHKTGNEKDYLVSIEANYLHCLAARLENTILTSVVLFAILYFCLC